MAARGGAGSSGSRRRRRQRQQWCHEVAASRIPAINPNLEVEGPEVQVVVLEQSNMRREPLAQDENRDENVEPVGTAECVEESGGSASGSLGFYQATSSRSRARAGGESHPPALSELEDGREDEDLDRRFNGNREAYDDYLTLQGKAVILDKGFEPTQLHHGLIAYMIREHGWTDFGTHHSEDSNWELVREFYANIDTRAETTWVRGKEIKIDAKSLNQFLGTKEQPGHLTYELINRIVVPGSEKEMVRRIARSVCDGSPDYLKGPTFHENQVRLELKPSLDFYFAKVKPITHTHRLSGISLFGLSEILLGQTVNIGEVISKTLLNRRKRRGGGGVLCHPNLIRRLSEQAGVDFADFSPEYAIRLGGPIPLIPWHAENEFRYELAPPLTAEQEGDQSQAPSPPPKRKAAPRKKRKRLEEGEERTINQGGVPTQTEVRTEQAPGATSNSQATQFTELSQTLMSLQREQAAQLRLTLEQQTAAMERQMAAMNETRLKEREMELQAQREAQREADERRFRAEREREMMRIQWEEERDRRSQKFQLQLSALLMKTSPADDQNAVATLLDLALGQPGQTSRPSSSTLPQAPPGNQNQPTSSVAPPQDQNQQPPPN